MMDRRDFLKGALGVTAAPALASGLAQDLTAWEDMATARPLTLWRAWDNPPPRTSQRRALKLLETNRTLLIFGGNRVGKTTMLRSVLVALVLGADHPDAREYWLSNGVDPSAFPRGPGRGWLIALTSNDSLRYHRQQILDLLPKWGPRHPMSEGEGRPWHAWNLWGKGEARIEVMVPGYSKPADIWFKSEDQGPDAFQGDRIRAALHDEEGQTEKSWEETDVRLWDEQGYHLMSDTPVRGRTWVYHRFVAKKEPGAETVWLHSEDNPYLPKGKLRQLAAGDPTVAAIRLRGEFVALEGRVWPQFARATHVVQPFPIPEGSPRFRSIDFGTRHPFACLWFALLKRAVTLPDGRRLPDGALVVYREHYQAEWTLAQHVARMRELEAGEQIEATWADPEDPQQLLQLVHTHGMTDVYKAIKAVTAGITCVAEWLAPGRDGLPGLYVVDTCSHTIREWESYCWGDRGTSERPVGQSDHTCDCGRYGCMGVRAWLG